MELPPLNYTAPTPYPSTPLVGTSPYLLGRGAPANLVDLSSDLRPSTTVQTKPQPVDGWARVQKGLEAPPPPVMDIAVSTRASLQNYAFDQRYKKQ